MKIDIGINEKDRAEIAEGLGKMLADSYSLYLQTQQRIQLHEKTGWMLRSLLQQ